MSLQKLYDADLVRLLFKRNMMTGRKQMKRIIVAGGGAAGFMSAFHAKTAGYRSDRSGGTGKNRGKSFWQPETENAT